MCMFEYLMYIFEVQMCMFGYLKTPDIILPLVSSRNLDWTHTFDTHCIYQHGKNVLYFFYNIAQRTLTEEWREIFRVDIELYQHGS